MAIPPNTTATVRVPTSDPTSVQEGTQAAKDATGLTLVRTETKAVVLSAASGVYRFEAAWK